MNGLTTFYTAAGRHHPGAGLKPALVARRVCRIARATRPKAGWLVSAPGLLASCSTYTVSTRPPNSRIPGGSMFRKKELVHQPVHLQQAVARKVKPVPIDDQIAPGL